jgi:uncharacterized protein (TIGR02996 family)
MNDVDRFLQAIRESPYDDNLRLVFADWLEDHGDPRGEMMRLEVELARLSEDDPQRVSLQQASFQLQQQHAAQWLGPLREIADCSFPRGQLTLVARADEFLPLLYLASGDYPWIERLQLSEIIPDGCNRLTELERLPNLTALDLSHNHLGRKLAGALLQLPNRAFLAELSLWQNALGDIDFIDLTRCGRFERLKVLDLSSNNLSWWFDVALFGRLLSDAFPQLDTLDLRGNPIDLEGLSELGRYTEHERLRKLYLGHCHLTNAAARHLAEAPHLSGLRLLMLAGNQIDSAGVSALAGSPELTAVEKLYLGNNPLGVEGAANLVRSALWPRLEALSLFACRIGDAGLVALAESGPTRLTWLDLAENGVGPAGIASLARSPLAATLTNLDLAGNVIGDAGAQELAESPHLNKLRRLDLQDNDLTDVGVTILANSPCLENLRVLNVGRNPIRRAGQAALRDRFGERVEW